MELKTGYKLTEVGVIPEDWNVRLLKEFSNLTSSKRIFESDYVDSGIPFYRGKEISLLITNKNLEDEYFISEYRYEEICRQFGAPIKGDILITAVGTLGNIYLIPNNKKFYFKDGNLIWLRNIRDIDNKFLTIQLRNCKKYIIDNAIGSSQKALTIVTLNQTCIATPPTKAEQQAIAEALSDADALIESLDQLITKKRNLKQGAMQELLTGKRRLPGFSGEWGVKRLVDIAQINPGINKPLSEMGAGVLYVTVQDLYSENSVNIERLGRIRLSAQETNLYALQSGDIIFGKSSVKRDGVGYPSIFRGAAEPAVCTGFSYRVRVFPSLADANYVFYALRWKPTRNWLIEHSQASALTNINKAISDSIPISLPELTEQTAIATILSEMDTELAGLESSLAKARQIKQGMMQELLTGRIRLV